MATRERLTREEREERIRIHVEQTIAGQDKLPTIAEVVECVGGSRTIIADVLREYRAFDGDFLPFNLSNTRTDDEPSEWLKRALELRQQLADLLKKERHEPLDAAETIRELRSERDFR